MKSSCVLARWRLSLTPSQETYIQRGTSVFIVHLSDGCRKTLKTAGIVNLITPDHIRPTVPAALQEGEDRV
jgi:hypothetical protein